MFSKSPSGPAEAAVELALLPTMTALRLLEEVAGGLLFLSAAMITEGDDADKDVCRPFGIIVRSASMPSERRSSSQSQSQS